MHLSDWPSSRLYSTSFTPPCSIYLCGAADGGALGTSGCASSEAVAELAVDGLEVAHAAGSGGLPALGLLAPVDCFVLTIDLRGRAGSERTLAGLSSRVAA
jgi:hypothetical protein